jgi:hypothetical protein
MQLNGRKVKNVEVDGVDTDDYPDFCDAFFSYAEYEDGTPLNDEELEQLEEDFGDHINLLAAEKMNDSTNEDYDLDR